MTDMIRNILLVGLGGAIGAMMRYGITLLFNALQWSANLGTLMTNIVGSFCMGLLVSACSQSPWLAMATIGVCGGFTTFSTFSMQSVTLLLNGKYGLASIYVLAAVVLCIAFAFLGFCVGGKMK